MKNTSLNTVHLSGHIGKDITLMQFDNGNKKASLSLASNFSYKSTTGDTVKHTDWFNLVAWGKTAEQLAESLTKGNEISIEGRLSTRSYTDKSGTTRYITEIVVNKFTKLVKGQPAEAPV
jgi:single-strand DNA-binding protein